MNDDLKIPVEARIHLNRFRPRPYQLPVLEAIENKGYKRAIAIMPRRAGKDVMAFNLCIRECLRRPCVIYYIFPTYSQGKKVLIDSLLSTGERFLDFIPKELLTSVNSTEMKIKFINGSILQVVGSDNVDSLMGTNPQGCVFSEYALQDPRAYQFIRPILAANNGWALFITTPRGKSHAYELFQIAQNSPNWFAYYITLNDTQHIPLEEIEKERAEGIMSEDLIQQEYYCSWDLGVEGSFYSKYLDRMKLEGRIGDVPWQPDQKVWTAWDIGVTDSTCIVFFEIYNSIIRVIDCYESSKQGLEHYVKVIQSKPYVYGGHIAPHDIKVKEWGSGMTRIEKAHHLGIDFIVCQNHTIMDGIEAVRSKLGIMYIDRDKCAPLLKALENYRQEYDAKKKTYKSTPLHDWSSHYADSFRYMCMSIAQLPTNSDPERVNRHYYEAQYGEESKLPREFRQRF